MKRLHSARWKRINKNNNKWKSVVKLVQKWKENDNSLMVINTDIAVEDKILSEISNIDGVKVAKYIQLTA